MAIQRKAILILALIFAVSMLACPVSAKTKIKGMQINHSTYYLPPTAYAKWKKVNGATSYTYTVKTKSGKLVKSASTTKLQTPSFKITRDNKRLIFTVKAYKGKKKLAEKTKKSATYGSLIAGGR